MSRRVFCKTAILSFRSRDPLNNPAGGDRQLLGPARDRLRARVVCNNEIHTRALHAPSNEISDTNKRGNYRSADSDCVHSPIFQPPPEKALPGPGIPVTSDRLRSSSRFINDDILLHLGDGGKRGGARSFLNKNGSRLADGGGFL